MRCGGCALFRSGNSLSLLTVLLQLEPIEMRLSYEDVRTMLKVTDNYTAGKQVRSVAIRLDPPCV